MEVACGKCGTALKVNRNLAGASVSCPNCGAPVRVPAEPPRRRAPSGPLALEADDGPPRTPPPFTLWLLGCQVALLLIGLGCLAGALFRGGWNPPPGSLFTENPLYLLGGGAGAVALSALVRRMPVLLSLLGALALLWVCALRYDAMGEVDASRTVALSLSMLAVCCALEHRRATGAGGPSGRR